MGDDSGGDDPAQFRRRPVHVAQQASAPRVGDRAVKLDGAHPGQVHHHPAVTDRQARHLVAASTHREGKAGLAGGAYRGGHVAGRMADSDDRWPAVDGRVPDAPRAGVSRVFGQDDLAAEGPGLQHAANVAPRLSDVHTVSALSIRCL